ncbi:MAG: hypothetical protein ACAI25_00240 [Planctomycetota bacterium]
MLGILGAAAGAVVGGVVGAGASVVSSVVRGDGLPSWGEVFAGAKKGALIGGLGVGGALLLASVLGVALPTLLAGAGAGAVAALLYSLVVKKQLPSWETLAAGTAGGVLAGGVLALALGAASFVGAGGIASAVAAPAATVAGTVVGGTLAKEGIEYQEAMDQEGKKPSPSEIVVPGDITRDPEKIEEAMKKSQPSQTPGVVNALSR